MFETTVLPAQYAETAQDGSYFHTLLGTEHGTLVDITLPPGRTTRAGVHRAHDEIWFIRHGQGEIWRSRDGQEEVVAVAPGTCLTIPAGTSFQFRTVGEQPLQFLVVQAPKWPDDDPAEFSYVDGTWTPAL